MLTYQLQPRIFKLSASQAEEFQFPCSCTINIEFSPVEAFGGGNNPSKAILGSGALKILYNSNCGRTLYQVNGTKEEVIIGMNGLRDGIILSQKGNLLTVSGNYNSSNDFEEDLYFFHYIIPIIYNTYFRQEVFVEKTHGVIGQKKFSWEIHKMSGNFKGMDLPDFKELLKECNLKIPLLFGNGENTRLFVAMSYLSRAKRLISAGNGPFEFMSEVILNYYKILNIIFGDTDGMRNELEKLGYTNEEIESVFIPITVLRNELDVGHASKKKLPQTFLYDLYTYLTYAEDNFSELIKKIISKVQDGTYTIKGDNSLEMTSKDVKGVEKLHSSIKNYLSKFQNSQ